MNYLKYQIFAIETWIAGGTPPNLILIRATYPPDPPLIGPMNEKFRIFRAFCYTPGCQPHLNELRITLVFQQSSFSGRWDGNFQRCRGAPFRSVRRPFVLPPLPSFHLPRKGIRDSKIRGGEGFLVSEFGKTRSREVKDRVPWREGDCEIETNLRRNSGIPVVYSRTLIT